MVMIYNCKTYATTILMKRHTKNRDFGNILRWGLLRGAVQFGVEGLGDYFDEISVNGEDGEKLQSTLSKTSS